MKLHITESSHNNEKHVAHVLLNGVLFQREFFPVRYTGFHILPCGDRKIVHAAFEN